MTTIIAGRFSQQDEVQQALAALQQLDGQAGQISSFYVNPAGQHDLYPIGGDRDESPGSQDSDKGMAVGLGAGGVIGGAAGMAAGPLGAITGALVGAHVGSLVGSLSQTDEAEDSPPQRKSGMLVAVSIFGAEQERHAIDTLRAAGATCIERAQGQIINGDWVDFDPLSTPHFV